MTVNWLCEFAFLLIRFLLIAFADFTAQSSEQVTSGAGMLHTDLSLISLLSLNDLFAGVCWPIRLGIRYI